MPRKPVDYSKTVIYKLVCNDLKITDIYVGSTSNFRTRKWSHKTSCNNEKSKKYKLKVYQTIRENGGWDNYSMIEIEKFSCKDGNEALARERYWYEELKSKLNTYSPTLNVEKRKEYNKKYNATEEQKQKQKEYHATEEQKEKKKNTTQHTVKNEIKKQENATLKRRQKRF